MGFGGNDKPKRREIGSCFAEHQKNKIENVNLLAAGRVVSAISCNFRCQYAPLISRECPLFTDRGEQGLNLNLECKAADCLPIMHFTHGQRDGLNPRNSPHFLKAKSNKSLNCLILQAKYMRSKYGS